MRGEGSHSVVPRQKAVPKLSKISTSDVLKRRPKLAWVRARAQLSLRWVDCHVLHTGSVAPDVSRKDIVINVGTLVCTFFPYFNHALSFCLIACFQWGKKNTSALLIFTVLIFFCFRYAVGLFFIFFLIFTRMTMHLGHFYGVCAILKGVHRSTFAINWPDRRRNANIFISSPFLI